MMSNSQTNLYAMKESLFIEQIMVIGEAQKMPAALIQPAFEYIEVWIKDQKLSIEPTIEDEPTMDDQILDLINP